MGSLSSAVLGPYLSLWLKSVGLSFSEIGLVQSVSELAQLLTDFPTGGLADRHGRVRVYAIGSSLFGLGLVIIGLSGGLWGVLAGASLSGLGSALVSGTMVPWLYDALGDRKLVKDVLSRLKALSGPARFAGGFFGGALAGLAPNAPVVIAGLLAIASGVMAVILLPDNRGKAELGYSGILRRGLHVVLENRGLHLLLLSSFLLSFTGRAFFTFWMLLLKAKGLPDEALGPLFATMLLSTSLGALLVRKLEPSPKTVALTSALLGVEVALLGLVPGLWGSVVLLFAIEVTLGARGPLMAVLRNDLIPSEVRSTVSSTLSTLGSGFTAIANVTIGLLAGKFGLGTAYLVAGLTGALSALPIWGLTFLSAPGEGCNIPEKPGGR
ncbi:MFS transporter [Thermococcus sp. 21S9]|uniref:MFS transporter n=1 Tax=Thermococcus sp. 21S9 TaxID=1638223 RepID=UPI003183F221